MLELSQTNMPKHPKENLTRGQDQIKETHNRIWFRLGISLQAYRAIATTRMSESYFFLFKKKKFSIKYGIVNFIYKQSPYGIKRNLLAWFKKHLFERTKKVVNKISSLSFSNVSQGSVFVVPFGLRQYTKKCIGDIGEKRLSLTGLYADDTSRCIPGRLQIIYKS